MIIVDSHCHLDYFEQEEVPDVIKHAQSLGVKYLQTICTKFVEFHDKILPFAKKYDNVFASVGIHPLECDKEKEITADDLITASQHEKVIGIGETGLDYYREGYPARDLQIRNLKSHIQASKETGLPLIIHNRSTDADMIRILKAEYTGYQDTRGLIHCFSSSRELAEVAIDLGFYISLSGIFTFNSSNELRSIVKEVVPHNRLLVETDAPFLIPNPPKETEKRNKPGYTYYVLKRLAEELELTEEEVATITTENFCRLFSKFSMN